jgi:hypothetical protein
MCELVEGIVTVPHIALLRRYSLTRIEKPVHVPEFHHDRAISSEQAFSDVASRR